MPKVNFMAIKSICLERGQEINIFNLIFFKFRYHDVQSCWQYFQTFSFPSEALSVALSLLPTLPPKKRIWGKRPNYSAGHMIILILTLPVLMYTDCHFYITKVSKTIDVCHISSQIFLSNVPHSLPSYILLFTFYLKKIVDT